MLKFTFLIRKIEKAGGAAKICGGGGKTKGTGMLLVYTNSSLKEFFIRYNLSYSKVILGGEGVREE